MTKTYYLDSVALAQGWVAALIENQALVNSASLTSATDVATIPKASSGQAAFAWASPSNEPNVATWPTNGAYTTVISVNAIGADIVLETTGGFKRISSDLATTVGSGGAHAWDSQTGTGLKTATDTWSAPGSTASDRFAFLVNVQNNAAHQDQSITLNLGTTATYMQGPWAAGGFTEQALPATSTFSPALGLLFLRTLAVAMTASPAIDRRVSYLKALAATSSFAPGLARLMFVVLAATSAFSAVAQRTMFVVLAVASAFGPIVNLLRTATLAVSSTFAVALARQSLYLKALAVTSTFGAALVKFLAVSLAAASTFGGALAKLVPRTLAATSTFAPAIQKVRNLTLAVGSAFALDLVRRATYGVSLAVASGFSAVMQRGFFVSLALGAVYGVGLAKGLSLDLAVVAVMTAAVVASRFVERTLDAASAFDSALGTLFIPGGGPPATVSSYLARLLHMRK